MSSSTFLFFNTFGIIFVLFLHVSLFNQDLHSCMKKGITHQLYLHNKLIVGMPLFSSSFQPAFIAQVNIDQATVHRILNSLSILRVPHKLNENTVIHFIWLRSNDLCKETLFSDIFDYRAKFSKRRHLNKSLFNCQSEPQWQIK